jgi:hypothetical protein
MTYNPANLPNQNVPDDFPLARPLDPYGVVDVDTAQNDIEWALKAIASQRKEKQLYADYMHGEHRLVFATTEYRAAFRQMLEGLKCNLCPAVVYAITDRLQIEGFGVQDGTPEANGQAAWTLWQQRNLDHQANILHDEAVSAGDAFLLVWPDQDGTPRFYPHTALEMAHKHDEERPEIITLATKLWKDGKRYRLTLYYADRIEKYITKQDSTQTPTKADACEPYQPTDRATGMPAEAWPVDNPYDQVPVFHFAFDSATHKHGCSEIKDVIPMQDLLNKTIADMAVAGEFGAYPQRYLLGIEPSVDAEGNEVPLPINAGINRLITVANSDVKAGQFDAANLEAYTKVIDAFFAMVARVKGIPLSYFFMSGDVPSGEALKTAESRLTKRVEKTMRSFGESWELALAFALKVIGTTDAQLTTTWAAPESRNDKDEVDVLDVKHNKLGVSQEQTWREAGYSVKEIADMKDEKAKAAPQPLQMAAQQQAQPAAATGVLPETIPAQQGA